MSCFGAACLGSCFVFGLFRVFCSLCVLVFFPFWFRCAVGFVCLLSGVAYLPSGDGGVGMPAFCRCTSVLNDVSCPFTRLRCLLSDFAFLSLVFSPLCVRSWVALIGGLVISSVPLRGLLKCHLGVFHLIINVFACSAFGATCLHMHVDPLFGSEIVKRGTWDYHSLWIVCFPLRPQR